MRKLTAEHITQIYKKCLSLLKRKQSGFIVFKRLQCYGWCKWDEDVLEIDPRKDLLRTAYHECVHYLYPDWSETQVIYTESRLINQCSILENIKFLKILTEKVYQSALKETRAKKKRKNYASQNR
jgi:hypothetical protein